MTLKQATSWFLPRRMVFAAAGLLVVAVILGVVGFLLATSGGALGTFLIWAASIVGMIAGGSALIGGLRRLRRLGLSMTICVMGILVLGVSLLGGIALIQEQVRNPLSRLSGESNDWAYSSTRIECQFGTALCTIDDPANQIRFRYGEAPSAVEVLDELRVVRFADTAVTLQSLRDSISIGPYDINVGGWMGASSPLETSRFIVDARGYLQPTSQAEQDVHGNTH